jgi:hypothetical protein
VGIPFWLFISRKAFKNAFLAASRPSDREKNAANRQPYRRKNRDLHVKRCHMKYCIGIILALLPTHVFASPEACVVLLHGLGRTAVSMIKLEGSLENSGYLVWNHTYPSRKKTIGELSSVVGEGVEYCRTNKARTIHFVTHSLGGILVREYFQNHQVPEAKRVVMLGPPNHGSEISDSYKAAWWYKQATGPAGQQLVTDPDSVPNKLKPIPLEVGIIAGKGGNDPLFSSQFMTEHDGKVSVVSAQLTEMKDFLMVNSGHTFIMNSAEVISQVKFFLREGKFSRKPIDADALQKTVKP